MNTLQSPHLPVQQYLPFTAKNMSFSSHLLPDALGNFLSMTRREEEVKERPGIMPYKPSIALTSICLRKYYYTPYTR